MSRKVELIPISEGNRIVVKTNDKIIIGRGSSLGVGLADIAGFLCSSFIVLV